jgi:hypothetical protein
MSADQATVVRLLLDVHNMQAGRVLPHEGTDPGTGWELVMVDDEILALDPECCEVIEVAPIGSSSFHIIVETGPHAGGLDPEPDLRDLVRLVEYLREHHVWVFVTQPDEDDSLHVSWTPLPLPGGNNDRRSEVLREGRSHHKGAVYVGPDGTVYDEYGIAL